MDFNALRAQTLGQGTDEEAVTVNTRALIDKVLARYSGEWTVLRELLQNAADASATKIKIKFETQPSLSTALPAESTPSAYLKHTVQHHTLKRLVVTNNGQAFTENDWSRLKRIAEGNPDETKIGAFGVGFYSTFSDCEEPFVSSGNEAMAFFWKNNSLFTRRLKLPESETSPDTNFVLDYRDTTTPVPALLPLAQFLASSLTFVGLENIELWLDGHNLLTFNKKASPSFNVTIPKDVETKTSEGFMKVTKLSKEVAQIDGQWMSIIGWKPPKSKTGRANDKDHAPSLRKFFSRLAGTPAEESQLDLASQTIKPTEQLTNKVTATIFLNVNTATVKTFTGQNFNDELERATKKPPPKTTKLAVLTAPYIENNNIAETAVAAGDVFGTVLPTKSGRIFIGFPTHQTTGLSAHISAPSVIPTVERESIDLNARYVRTWNIELLRAAGIVCRIAWSTELNDLKDKILRSIHPRTKVRSDDVNPILPEAITTFKNFSFRESTPSSKISEILEDAFWTCSKQASIEVLSTCGVLPTHEVRLAPKDLTFMEGIPTLPEQLVSEAKTLIDKLVDFGLITDVTVSDIKKALETTPLSSIQVSEFLRWIIKQSSRGQMDNSTVQNLLAVAVANNENADGSPSQIIVLGQMQHFLNASRTPVDMPVPPTVMPFKFTKTLNKHELESLGWQELQLVPWIRWLLSVAGDRNVLSIEKDLTKTPAFSAQILPLLSKQWDSLSQSSKTSLVELLAAHTVIPTKNGMKKPGDSYFPQVKLFDDLPTITGLGTVKDKFLVALGVRKTVELGVIFERLLATETQADVSNSDQKSQWSHVELINYLASVREDIPGPDIQRLRNTPVCPKLVKGEGETGSKRFKVSELFEPRPELKDLGLPCLSWPGIYRSGSPEGKLLSVLGLRTIPQVNELIEIMAKAGARGDSDLRDKALAYFLSHHHSHNYSSFDYSKVILPFLPLEGKTQLTTPSGCYIDEGAALLGFDVLKRDWVPHAQRFGIQMNPPMDQCIKILAQKPPLTHHDARAIFSYFARRLGEVNNANIPHLNQLAFIPIFTKDKEKSAPRRFASPRNCFLGDSDAFGEIFDYVDFGQEGNSFLMRCGSKPEPSIVEVAQVLVREPGRISATFRNPEKYLALLRSMADNIAILKKNQDLFKEMRRAPFLLAYKELPVSDSQPLKTTARTDEVDDFEEEEELQGIREHHLCGAGNAIVIDDIINYNLFKSSILAAPQEETLEAFYYALGASSLSNLVDESVKHGPRSTDQRHAQKLQKQISERTKLFLHDQSPDSIKHDTKWLEKNLTVQAVSSITLTKSLKGRDVTHSEKRSAVVVRMNREFILWIAGEHPDFYQVSQALVHLLLNRPKPHSALTLEMLLKTDLLDLRARGFNVSRILRLKAAEDRLANAKRQQELEEEQSRIERDEKSWKALQGQTSTKRTQQPQLPGQFPESPESTPNTNRPISSQDNSNVRDNTRNMFANLSRQFGLGSNRHVQSLLGQQGNNQPTPSITSGNPEAPPPYSYTQQGSGGQVQGPNQGITAPHQLRENLLDAIRKSRSHSSNDVYSRGETNVVTETQSYCDEHPAHDLNYIAEIKHGIQMFMAEMSINDKTSFLTQNNAGLQTFANLLKNVAEVFSLNPNTVNIFYETSGKTIAFNRNGSIFCNFLYFKQLHDESIKAGTGHSEAFIYWWVIFCHELAHNLVGDHSSNHSYYTEGFVMQYFARVVAVLSRIEGRREQAQLQQSQQQAQLQERPPPQLVAPIFPNPPQLQQRGRGDPQ